MSTFRARWAWTVALLAAAPGCHKEWQADTMTPPITFGANLDSRTSLPAIILLRDMELPRTMWLPNSVYFVAVSKDRVRFHVTLVHKSEDMSDPTRWRVWLEDDRGHRYLPSGVDRRHIRPVTRMYDVVRRRVDQRDRANSAFPHDTPTVHLDPLFAVTVYKGDGDYVFYRRDLVRSDMRSLTLVMQRPGYEYRYRWMFVEGVEEDEDVRPRGCGSVEETCRPIAASPAL